MRRRNHNRTQAYTMTIEKDQVAGMKVGIESYSSIKDILKRADTLLYQSKANGRNCVTTG